jgi:hypothetical protein
MVFKVKVAPKWQRSEGTYVNRFNPELIPMAVEEFTLVPLLRLFYYRILQVNIQSVGVTELR